MSRIAVGGMKPLWRLGHDVPHDHGAVLQPHDGLPGDDGPGADRLLALGSLEAREKAPRPGDEAHQQPAAVRSRHRAQIVHAAEPLAALAAHDRTYQLARANHESGSLATKGARRSSPLASPRSRAL